MPDKTTPPSRRGALTMLAATPLVGASAWPAAAQSAGQTQWTPRLARPFIADQFDRLEIHQDSGAFDHRGPPTASRIVYEGYGTVVLPGETAWTPITAALSHVRTHSRRVGPESYILTNVVLMKRDGKVVHELAYSLWPGHTTGPGLEGELDGAPVFVNRELPDLLQRLHPTLSFSPNHGYR